MFYVKIRAHALCNWFLFIAVTISNFCFGSDKNILAELKFRNEKPSEIYTRLKEEFDDLKRHAVAYKGYLAAKPNTPEFKRKVQAQEGIKETKQKIEADFQKLRWAMPPATSDVGKVALKSLKKLTDTDLFFKFGQDSNNRSLLDNAFNQLIGYEKAHETDLKPKSKEIVAKAINALTDVLMNMSEVSNKEFDLLSENWEKTTPELQEELLEKIPVKEQTDSKKYKMAEAIQSSENVGLIKNNFEAFNNALNAVKKNPQDKLAVADLAFIQSDLQWSVQALISKLPPTAKNRRKFLVNVEKLSDPNVFEKFVAAGNYQFLSKALDELKQNKENDEDIASGFTMIAPPSELARKQEELSGSVMNQPLMDALTAFNNALNDILFPRKKSVPDENIVVDDLLSSTITQRGERPIERGYNVKEDIRGMVEATPIKFLSFEPQIIRYDVRKALKRAPATTAIPAPVVSEEGKSLTATSVPTSISSAATTTAPLLTPTPSPFPVSSPSLPETEERQKVRKEVADLIERASKNALRDRVDMELVTKLLRDQYQFLQGDEDKTLQGIFVNQASKQELDVLLKKRSGAKETDQPSQPTASQGASTTTPVLTLTPSPVPVPVPTETPGATVTISKEQERVRKSAEGVWTPPTSPESSPATSLVISTTPPTPSSSPLPAVLGLQQVPSSDPLATTPTFAPASTITTSTPTPSPISIPFSTSPALAPMAATKPSSTSKQIAPTPVPISKPTPKQPGFWNWWSTSYVGSTVNAAVKSVTEWFGRIFSFSFFS